MAEFERAPQAFGEDDEDRIAGLDVDYTGCQQINPPDGTIPRFRRGPSLKAALLEVAAEEPALTDVANELARALR